jgi:hypothetical protein
MLVSLGNGSAFKQPGRLQLQAAFARLSVSLAIAVDQ